MHKFHFDPVKDEDKEDPKELMWHNLRQADKYHKLDVFIGSSMAWFNQNPDKNYHDFEQALRVQKLNTHLYAIEVNLEENQELKLQGSDQECLYKCVFSCRPKELAIQEVMKHCDSYEDNLERLKKAGVLCLKDETEIKNAENAYELKEDEKGRMEKLKSLKVKVRVEEITAEDIIEDINKQIEEKFNKEADVMVIGKTDSGDPIYAFTLEQRLVSDIGFSVRQTSNCPEYEIIQLEHTEDS